MQTTQEASCKLILIREVPGVLSFHSGSWSRTASALTKCAVRSLRREKGTAEEDEELCVEANKGEAGGLLV